MQMVLAQGGHVENMLIPQARGACSYGLRRGVLSPRLTGEVGRSCALRTVGGARLRCGKACIQGAKEVYTEARLQSVVSYRLSAFR